MGSYSKRFGICLLQTYRFEDEVWACFVQLILVAAVEQVIKTFKMGFERFFVAFLACFLAYHV